MLVTLRDPLAALKHDIVSAGLVACGPVVVLPEASAAWAHTALCRPAIVAVDRA